jgi:hypothetical protein
MPDSPTLKEAAESGSDAPPCSAGELISKLGRVLMKIIIGHHLESPLRDKVTEEAHLAIWEYDDWMKKHSATATGYRCSLDQCPPGLFRHGDDFGFKTEYRDQNGPEAYCADSGEYFWGGTDDKEVRRNLQVMPFSLPNDKIQP